MLVSKMSTDMVNKYSIRYLLTYLKNIFFAFNNLITKCQGILNSVLSEENCIDVFNCGCPKE